MSRHDIAYPVSLRLQDGQDQLLMGLSPRKPGGGADGSNAASAPAVRGVQVDGVHN